MGGWGGGGPTTLRSVGSRFECIPSSFLLPPPPPARSPHHSTSHHITSHHITSHHITSHHNTSHHITSHHITSHHITSHHITHQIVSHITSHHITSIHITSHHIASHHITSHHITSHHITSHHVTSHHITSHHITPRHTAHTINPSFSLRIPYLLLSILGPTLGADSANPPNLPHRTHLKSFIFLTNSLHFALHTGGHSWCNFSDVAKSPAPHTPEILHFPYEFLTFCFPYWGPLLVQFQRSRQISRTAHT